MQRCVIVGIRPTVSHEWSNIVSVLKNPEVMSFGEANSPRMATEKTLVIGLEFDYIQPHLRYLRQNRTVFHYNKPRTSDTDTETDNFMRRKTVRFGTRSMELQQQQQQQQCTVVPTRPRSQIYFRFLRVHPSLPARA